MKIRPKVYDLLGHEPVPTDIENIDPEIWSDMAKRRVAHDQVSDVEVSTVFLVLDQAWDGKPMLFETMLFGGVSNRARWQYSTWDEAASGHRQVIEALMRGEDMAEFEPGWPYSG